MTRMSSSQQYSNLYVKSIIISLGSIAGVPFDLVGRFRATLLLRTTCMCRCYNWVASCVSALQPKHQNQNLDWFKAGLGIFETNVRIQWNPVYNAFHRIRCYVNETFTWAQAMARGSPWILLSAGPRFVSDRKHVTSDSHGFEQKDPQARVLKYCYQ